MSKRLADTYRQWCPRCLDFHAHFLNREVFARAEPHGVTSCFGARSRPIDGENFRRMFDPAAQVADMDERGIDAYIISSADVIQGRTWAEPAEEAYLGALVNDQAADWVARFPGRFIGTCTLPLGDMDAALRELERGLSMGLRIIHLPSNYRGLYLGHTRYEELWAAAVEHGLTVFVHPDGVRDMWFQDYAMWNSIGQSIEEVKVMSSLIYEGVMDRHRGLKIVMSHGGGYMPHYMGRLDRNVSDKPQTARNLSKMPSDYLRDFYYDSCVYDARTLEILVERVGADRIVLGGDYPVAALDPIDFLASARHLTDEQRAAIAGGTASRLLGLE